MCWQRGRREHRHTHGRSDRQVQALSRDRHGGLPGDGLVLELSRHDVAQQRITTTSVSPGRPRKPSARPSPQPADNHPKMRSRQQKRMTHASWRGGTVVTAYEAIAFSSAGLAVRNVALVRSAGKCGWFRQPRLGTRGGRCPVDCQRGYRLRNRCTCSFPPRSSPVSISAGYAVSSS